MIIENLQLLRNSATAKKVVQNYIYLPESSFLELF